ncbi:hypothetical protein C5749_06875 [Sphingobacterium gobiense]|uniref:Uncharacterized protein n=1 Tax=Sphingobacterium gobiense TaxID=1382456 RepID=A0A2S9JUF1_9SPHI|nr:hypothetical protein C5749_06875 [Sphingobacterium gobiense]
MLYSTKLQLDQYLIFLGKTSVMPGEFFTDYRCGFIVDIFGSSYSIAFPKVKVFITSCLLLSLLCPDCSNMNKNCTFADV